MLITLVLLAGLTHATDFPTARVFETLAACRATCFADLDALARAASRGREILVPTAEIDADVEVVRENGRALRDRDVALARPLSPAAGRPRSFAGPLDAAEWVDVLRARSRLAPRELAIEVEVRRQRRRDPYLHLFVPPPDRGESRLTLNLVAEGETLVLNGVAPNSNLDRVGLGLGDRVKRVAGLEFTSRGAAGVIRSLPAGETLRLSVEKITGETVDVEIPRVEAVEQSVSSYVVTANAARVGVVRIQSFADARACARTEVELRRLAEARVERLIYDLRANPGGRVEEARCVLGLHLGRGKKLWRQRLLEDTPTFAQAKSVFPVDETLFTDRDRAAPDVPTVVVINAASASATELAAASLQERGAAWIVGARSFGKGVAQAVLPLVPGFALPAWKTIARAEHAGGYSVQGHGVRPDFLVKSEMGGAHDADDELRVRFTDAHGAAFVTSASMFRRDAARARAYRRVKRCARLSSLKTDETAARWLRDRQLRGAVTVALCAE